MPLVDGNLYAKPTCIPPTLLGPVRTIWPHDLRVGSATDIRVDFFATALREPVWSDAHWREPQMSLEADESQIIRLLERLFTFVRASEVQDFLWEHSHLIPLLLEARVQLATYFGQDSPVSLKVVTDPGSAGDSQLFVLVGTSMSPQEAFNALDRFDKKWWLEAGVEASGKLEVDVIFS